MTLIFRPDMKAIVHDVDGTPANVVGRTIDGGTALVAMVERFDETELRAGARVRCSYVEPTGVHVFDSTIRSAEALTFNHRMVRLSIDAPTEAEHFQRRGDVRVGIDLEVRVHLPATDRVETCTSVDLGAGGIAMAWGDRPLPEVGEDLRVAFATERFEHDHDAIALGSHSLGPHRVLRAQFVGLSPAERNRLVTAVFALQRSTLQRQRDASSLR